MIDLQKWIELHREFTAKGVTLVAVSKKKPASDIQELYDAGQRDFGENYVQELVEKQPSLPADIRWHFIGHLQRNKVKEIAPFVHLIHAVDNFPLLREINKHAAKCNRVIDVLLQMYIASEETKFGMDEPEILEFLAEYARQKDQLANVRIRGLMGMATNTDHQELIRKEFAGLHSLLTQLSGSTFAGVSSFTICSMGMSADYPLAIEAGGNMVRIGSLLFGKREY